MTMRAVRPRPGFTLVELMIATFVFGLVVTCTWGSFSGATRLLRTTMARQEMSLRARELRDKLLFHATPDYNRTRWSGLLSATNGGQIVQGNGTKLVLFCPALKESTDGSFSGNGSVQTLQLLLRDDNSEKRSLFSEDRHDERWKFRWLHPGNLNLFAANSARNPVFDDRHLANTNRLYVNFTGRVKVGAQVVEHNERVVVPLYGKTQPTATNKGGGL